MIVFCMGVLRGVRICV
jgi:hypothetical protein